MSTEDTVGKKVDWQAVLSNMKSPFFDPGIKEDDDVVKKEWKIWFLEDPTHIGIKKMILEDKEPVIEKDFYEFKIKVLVDSEWEEKTWQTYFSASDNSLWGEIMRLVKKNKQTLENVKATLIVTKKKKKGKNKKTTTEINSYKLVGE